MTPEAQALIALAERCEAASVFEAFGLRVTVEPCTDQSDDGPDGLSIR